MSIFALRGYQRQPVKDLVSQVLASLDELAAGVEKPKEARLGAPTGSGKTSMAFAVLTELADKHPDRNLAFIWVAPGKLHEQAAKDVRWVSGNLLTPATTNDAIDRLPRNWVLLVNWASIDRPGNRWRKSNERGEYLAAVVERTRQEGRQIVVVIDESHHGYDQLSATAAHEVMALIGLSARLAMSATLKDATCQVDRADAVRDGMLRETVRQNYGFPIENRDSEDLEMSLLDEALRKRTELAQLYGQATTKAINPLLIIQVANAAQHGNASIAQYKETLLARGFEELDVRKVASGRPQFVVYVSDQKLRTTYGISGPRDPLLVDPNGIVDVVICKQAIALGWDCPRAQVLYKVREPSTTPTFDIQTVGRIMRTVETERGCRYDKPFEDLNYGYLYTLDEYADPNRQFGGLENAYAHLRERDGAPIAPPPLRSAAAFPQTGEVEPEEMRAIVQDALSLLSETRLSLEAFDRVRVGEEFTEEGRVRGATDSTTGGRGINRSESEFYKITDRWAGGPVAGAILRAEIYWQLHERDGHLDVPRVQNALSDSANQAFGDKVARAVRQLRRERGIDGRETVEEATWVLPNPRPYNMATARSKPNDETTYEKVEDSHSIYAYELCYLRRRRPKPESTFEEWLGQEGTAKRIDWWVKNGDVRGQDFGILYHLPRAGAPVTGARNEVAHGVERHDAEARTFLPDYIVRWMDGKMGFYETKDDAAFTDRGDLTENLAKEAALRAFIAEDPEHREGFFVQLWNHGDLRYRDPDGLLRPVDYIRQNHPAPD